MSGVNRKRKSKTQVKKGVNFWEIGTFFYSILRNLSWFGGFGGLNQKMKLNYILIIFPSLRFLR